MLRKAYDLIVPPKPDEATRKRGRYPLIDSTRAIAALLIFGFHLSLQLGLPEWTKDYTNTLSAGVPVFFVISGFVLFRPFARDYLVGQSQPQTIPYAWRRFLRIVPAFYLALTIYLVFGSKHVDSGDIPLFYGFAQVYSPDTVLGALGQAWSLDCEIVYYALIPLTMVVIRALPAADQAVRLRREIWGLVFLFALAVTYKIWFYAWGGSPENARDGVFEFTPGWNLDMFVMGMALALWSVHREITGTTDFVSRFIARRAEVIWALAILLFLVISWENKRAFDDVGNVAIHYATALFGLCVLLPAVWGRIGHGPVRRFLGNRYLLAVGVVSYSFYLFHTMVLSETLSRWPGSDIGTLHDVGVAVVAVVGSIAVACGVYLFVERPAMNLRRLIPDDSRGAGPQQPFAAHAPEGRAG
jgi:peptidoglycan/LPS O-acetylase OafA/YrhL